MALERLEVGDYFPRRNVRHREEAGIVCSMKEWSKYTCT